MAEKIEIQQMGTDEGTLQWPLGKDWDLEALAKEAGYAERHPVFQV